MKIFVLATNLLGYKILSFLLSKNENILGVGLIKKNPYNDIIIKNLKKNKIKYYYLTKNINKLFLKKILDMKLDFILSVSWPYILNKNFYSLSQFGTLNFHLSFLPFNRGKNPNVWPIVEKTPAGVTIHLVNNKIDDGDIIYQKKIKIDYIDTAKTLYQKLNLSLIKLFKKNWINIKKHNYKKIKNIKKLGTFHMSSDFKKIEKINLNKKIYPMDLINQLRAKMFYPNPCAYFEINNKKVFVEIKLKYKKNK